MPAIRTAIQRQRQNRRKKNYPYSRPKFELAEELPACRSMKPILSISIPLPHGFRAQIGTEKREEVFPAGELSPLPLVLSVPFDEQLSEARFLLRPLATAINSLELFL